LIFSIWLDGVSSSEFCRRGAWRSGVIMHARAVCIGLVHREGDVAKAPPLCVHTQDRRGVCSSVLVLEWDYWVLIEEKRDRLTRANYLLLHYCTKILLILAEV
jgi:hypothetical protein